MADDLAQFDALPVPADALKRGGFEVFRAVIVEDSLQVSLRRAFEHPGMWGILIADVARHAARIFATETNLTEEQAIEHIRFIFDAEMDSPTARGETSAIS